MLVTGTTGFKGAWLAELLLELVVVHLARPLHQLEAAARRALRHAETAPSIPEMKQMEQLIACILRATNGQRIGSTVKQVKALRARKQTRSLN